MRGGGWRREGARAPCPLLVRRHLLTVVVVRLAPSRPSPPARRHCCPLVTARPDLARPSPRLARRCRLSDRALLFVAAAPYSSPSLRSLLSAVAALPARGRCGGGDAGGVVPPRDVAVA